MIYNVVLVSGVQQSDSIIHLYMYILFFFTFSSIIGYYKILSIVLCATQQVLVGFIYISVYM